MKKLICWLSLALVVSSCTIQRKEFNFAIQPIDPPMVPVKTMECLTVGYDGLACRVDGLHI